MNEFNLANAVMLCALAIIEAMLVATCVRWHIRHRRGTGLILKLRAQLPKPLAKRGKLVAAVHFLWSKACIVGFIFVPVLLAIIHGIYSEPIQSGTFVLIALWALMPFGELCAIKNQCEILDLRILNSELEILRNHYVDKTATP